MRVAPRTEVRVIPDLLHGRDEHLTRDTEFPAVRGYEESGPRGGDCGLLQTGHWREVRRCCWPRLTPAFVLARVFHANGAGVAACVREQQSATTPAD